MAHRSPIGRPLHVTPSINTLLLNQNSGLIITVLHTPAAESPAGIPARRCGQLKSVKGPGEAPWSELSVQGDYAALWPNCTGSTSIQAPN